MNGVNKRQPILLLIARFRIGILCHAWLAPILPKYKATTVGIGGHGDWNSPLYKGAFNNVQAFLAAYVQ
jgi:hypothetical protein